MASYVLKIKYGDVLRRVTVETSLLGNGPDMTFTQLEEIIRQAFKIPATSDVGITYTDNDNDVVTMAGDHDLHDAFVLQGLNPLRLTVTVQEWQRPAQESQRPAHHARHGGRWGHGHGHGHGHSHGRPQSQPETKMMDLKNLFANTIKMSHDTAKQTLEQLEPLIKGAPSTVVSEVMEALGKLASSAHMGSAAVGTPAQPAPPSSQMGTPEQIDFFPNFGAHFPPPPHPGFPDFPPFPHFPAFPRIPSPGHSLVPESAVPVGPSGDKEQSPPAASQDSKDAVHHQGVKCDVCGIVPIIGTRYKSNKKHDYDLCHSCFQKFGIIEDYTQIDRPLWRPRHFSPQFGSGRMRCPAFPPSYGGRPFHMRGPHMHGPHGPHGFHGPYAGKGDSRCGGGYGGAGGKLDARFVQDVTIFDGTEFAPGTAFTKIWRLRNSGSCSWPKLTQLMHVGGDEMGSVVPVTLELPEEGLGPDGEAEVSVDLVAPEKPGRYVSHWRLVSPTGQKFGHRVWVLIQVVPNDEQSPQMMESLMAASQSSQDDTEMLEQEAEGRAPAKSEAMDINDALLLAADVVSVVVPELGSKEPEVEMAAAEKVQYPEISMEALTLDSVEIESGKGQEEKDAAVEDSELGNFSMVNMPTVTEVPVYTPESKNTVDAGVVVVDDEPADSGKEEMRTAAVADSVDVMLGTLESMGFKQRDLNQELLKKNEFDLQRTLDDLVMAAEWDSMLEELEEMGFYDTDMNRRLMFKNNGSVKRVVKELVQMYKDPKGKEQI